MSQSKTRTIVALAGAALLVFVAAVAAVVTIAVRHTDQPSPEITAYAHGRSVSVNPYLYCDLQVSKERLAVGKCDSTKAVSDLDVPPGSPLQLSLPKEIADAPWEILLGYRIPGPKGDTAEPVLITSQDYPDKPLAITIKTPANEHVRLAIMELHLPIPARDEAGNEGVVSRGIWSIQTPAFDPALFS
ncbi:DUF2771 family protein [Nocardia sp. CDC160]|uniref:DUF2771 family protein n=1 Tax=Nocardia sp. CDC160 TaxID=3112166 RepID=UPI002DB7F72D|nr:DUF2771 family protein [Nocardia sp. CDC160]MEC3913518.1 DUF2771 family protein [Nocardia sp. CDC160]